MIIDEQNIESLILDYIDDELSSSEERELMQYIAAHPQYQVLLDQYKSTKYEPAFVPAYDSTHLLQTEAKVMPMKISIMRIAAAVAVLMSVALGYYIFDLNSSEREHIGATATLQPSKPPLPMATQEVKQQATTSQNTSPANTAVINSTRTRALPTNVKIIHVSTPSDVESTIPHMPTAIPMDAIVTQAQWKKADYTVQIYTNVIKPEAINLSAKHSTHTNNMSWFIDNEQLSGIAMMTSSIKEIARNLNNEVPSQLSFFNKTIALKK